MTNFGTPTVTVVARPVETRPNANRKLYLALAGVTLAAILGGAGLKLMYSAKSASEATAATPTADDTVAATNPEATATEPLVASFATPFVQASPSLQLADPALLQSTSSQSRIETIAAGRPDPFAPLVTPNRALQKPTPMAVPAPPPPPTGAVAVQPTVAQPLPVVPVAATQSLPPLPQGIPSLPSLPIPMVPGSFAPEGEVAVAPNANPVPLSVIDQVAVSGVVQIGSSVHAIITEPGNSSGRRVAQGDTVAGGRIRVKRIDVSGADPVVVLTYEGRDHYRTVGSGAMLGSL